MYITFAVKETSYLRFSVNVPKEMKDASDEELKKWIQSGDAYSQNVEFVRTLDVLESTPDTDYEFEVTRR